MDAFNANIVNMTPHSITVHANGESVTYPVSGTVARVTVSNISDGVINGIPVYKPVYGDVYGLPRPEPGVIFIVSMLVAQQVPGRDDIVCPDSGPSAIRDDAGQILAVRGFIRY